MRFLNRGDVHSSRTVRSARRPETLPSAVAVAADASNADDSFERPATGSSRSAPPGRPVAFDPKELSGGWRWGDGHPMSFSLAAVAAATAARAPVPRAAARSRRDGAPKISARTRQVRASAPRTLPSPAAPKRAPRTGRPRVRLKGQFITWRLRGFWRPTTRPRVAPRWPSSSRPRARRDVGVFTPAPPIRDVAPKSTRRRLTGSLPRSHPPRVSASRE